MKIPTSVRNEISSLSTGNSNKDFPRGQAPYYEQYHHFYNRLVEILKTHSLIMFTDCAETVYNDRGKFRIAIVSENYETLKWPPSDFLIISYYRMEQTGNWEIIVCLP